MIKESKKAIAYMKLVGLIIGVLFLIIMLFYMNASSEAAKYEQSLVMCNQFFKGINGKPLYFNETSSAFTPKLSNSLRDLCPSKTVEVSSKNVKPALDLMKDCWFKTGSGTDFFPLIATDMKLCFYCGKIKSDGDITDFKEKISSELKKEEYSNLVSKDSEIINLNYATFETSVPETFADEKELALYYYIYKPPVKVGDSLLADINTYGKDVIVRSIRDFVGATFDIGPIFNHYVLDELLIGELVRTNGGIVLIAQDEPEEDDFENLKSNIVTRGCYVIYPVKNYD